VLAIPFSFLAAGRHTLALKSDEMTLFFDEGELAIKQDKR
jgi:hypothetical protein